MGNMQLIEIATGLLIVWTSRRQCQTKFDVWIREEIYPSNNTLGTTSSSIRIFCENQNRNTSQLSNQLYNCDHHLHHGHRHHHHALYITHEEQDGQRASGRITVTPHIWLSKLHCCNAERRPTKLYCTQLGIWLRLFFCTTKQLSSKDKPYQSPQIMKPSTCNPSNKNTLGFEVF